MLLLLAVMAPACSKPVVQVITPEERLANARRDIEKKRYESAVESLEELKTVTVGTRLGGEVQFLLGEGHFLQGKYEEAQVDYETYLAAYPGGPFSEKALFRQASALLGQIRKTSIGFLTFKSYIPYDRDISVLRDARSLFERYLLEYPSGQWVHDAGERAAELRAKEGQHELEIASFYLRKGKPQAAMARARRVLGGDFPEEIKAEAMELARKTGLELPSGSGTQPN